MDIDQLGSELSSFSARACAMREKIMTEEAVKMAVILPFFKMLGFDPYNPEEIIPEYTADIGIKRGEKVDYAISLNQQIEILVECKSPQTPLRFEHASQLCRYFNVANARIAVLTNGFDWHFYTDSEKRNVMDQKPFLEFNLSKLDRREVKQIAKFRKDKFCLDRILETASELKYRAALESEFRSEILEPSDEFVELLTRRVCDGRFTQSRKDQFRPLVKNSINEVLRESVSALLANALERSSGSEIEHEELQPSGIVTTEEEEQGLRIVQAICAELVPSSRIAMRDQKASCAIIMDDNRRKPLVRLWFNAPGKKFVGLFDGESEEKMPVDTAEDLFQFTHRIKQTLKNYLSAEAAKQRAG
ncbi:MAG: type I restriction enzyme HsdR N-terminal domain-containing protein [Pseudomonadota bacterium]